MDMAEAEGVGALIAAETEGQRRQALRALNGEIGVLARRWRTRIIAALGLAETSIDFVEEQLGDGLLAQAAAELESLILEMSSHVDDASAVAHAPDRPTVALIGPPNVGKSSFLNALLGSERAITSAEPGTTRDTIEIRLLVEGREVIVVDTAGIRHARTDIEEEGVARTWRVAESADLRVFLISADTKTAFRDAGLAPDAADGLFWTKADLAEPSEAVCGDHGAFSATVSIVDPAALRTAFARFVKAKLPSAAAPLSPLAGAARRIAITERARSAAREAVASLHEGHPELGIAKMHEVGRHLEALTGVVGQEDVLDALFSRFCIGK
ncbi:MAG: GTPase [Pseudomonadota bacterium]